MPRNSIKEIMTDFMSLGLVEPSKIKHSVKDTGVGLTEEQAKENATVDLDPYAAVPENKTVKINIRDA